mmetsp:Transcript_88886/g.163007  ORF Transcript_88886/g.163007 Transcript_88886/m.163007 type:complete len:373 (-) Transcript_88886:156-1274(-)
MSHLCGVAHLALATLLYSEHAISGAHTPAVCGRHSSCGNAGVMLLAINSSLRSVSWSPNKIRADAAAGKSSSERLQPANRLLLLDSKSNNAGATQRVDLEYDSNNNDGEMDASTDWDMSASEQHTRYDDDVDSEMIDSSHADSFRAATYTPAIWNSLPEIRFSHNCYMYALNDFSPRSKHSCTQRRSDLVSFMGKQGSHRNTSQKERKLQQACRRYFHKPGYYFQNSVLGRTTTDTWDKSETSCNFMLPMIAADSPSILWNNALTNRSFDEDDRCPEGHYMAALVVDPKKGFHFYRRDRTCSKAEKGKVKCWSHKPGILEATDVDASGKKLASVLKADRNYGALNYSELCSFFCVPENSVAATHSDSRRVAS